MVINPPQKNNLQASFRSSTTFGGLITTRKNGYNAKIIKPNRDLRGIQIKYIHTKLTMKINPSDAINLL